MSEKYEKKMMKVEKNCIYCVSKISLASTQFRFPNDRKVLPNDHYKPDPQLESFGKPAADYPMVYDPPLSEKHLKKIKVNVINDLGIENSVELIDRVCNICHHTLPHDFFENNYRIISIVGAKGVGKTCFIASMLKDMSEQFHKLGISFEFVGNSSDQYHQLYETFIEDGIAPATTDVHAYVPPLLIKLSSKEKDETNLMFLAIHDISGEAFNENQLETLGKYIPNSHALILLVDPFQEPTIRKKIDQHKSICNSDEYKNIDKKKPVKQIIDKVNQFIKQRAELENGKIKSHCALCFSKLDAIHELDENEILSNIFKNSVYDHHIDYKSASEKELNQLYDHIHTTIYENHKHMEALLESWDLSAVLNSLEYNFKSYRIFAVSSSIHFNVPIPIKAQHVSDPILWFCEEFKLLPSQVIKEEKQEIYVLISLIFVILLGILGLLKYMDSDQTSPLPDQNISVKIHPSDLPIDMKLETIPGYQNMAKIEIEWVSLNTSSEFPKISKNEISVEDYDKCVRDNACLQPKMQNKDCLYPQYKLEPEQYKTYPMNCLNESEVKIFIRYLQKEIHNNVNIPSESLWMSATKFKETANLNSKQKKKLKLKYNDYPWGNEVPSCKFANLADCEKVADWKCRGQHPLHICNLIGNLSERVFMKNRKWIIKGGNYTTPLSIIANDIESDQTDLAYIGLRLAIEKDVE